MAELRLRAASGAFAVAAAATKTFIQIKAPTNQRIVITGISITGQSAAGGTDKPCVCKLKRCLAAITSFGTAGSTPTASKVDGSDTETPQAVVGIQFSAEPTAGAPNYTDLNWTKDVNPQNGYVEILEGDKQIIINGGMAVGMEITNNGSASATFDVEFLFKE